MSDYWYRRGQRFATRSVEKKGSVGSWEETRSAVMRAAARALRLQTHQRVPWRQRQRWRQGVVRALETIQQRQADEALGWYILDELNNQAVMEMAATQWEMLNHEIQRQDEVRARFQRRQREDEEAKEKGKFWAKMKGDFF